MSDGNNTELKKRVAQAAEIFEKYSRLIRATIQIYAIDQSDADDIYQDFFLSLIRKPIPPDVNDLPCYIYRAVRNDILDAARQSITYQGRVSTFAQSSQHPILPQDPHHILINEEKKHALLKVIEQQLPPHQAQALIQYYGLGTNTPNAARKMNVKKRTFSRYLCVGRKKIRQIIDQSFEQYPYQF